MKTVDIVICHLYDHYNAQLPLLLHHPLGGEDLAGHQGAGDGDQAEPEPGCVAARVEGVGGDEVEHDIAEVGCQRHDVEQDVTNGQELHPHAAAASSRSHLTVFPSSSYQADPTTALHTRWNVWLPTLAVTG